MEKAAELALSTCPRTTWAPAPIYDHRDLRLSFETMVAQLLDEASRARARLFVMIALWASTHEWPRFNGPPVYFLREVLEYGARCGKLPQGSDFPETPPPWKPKHVALFLDATALGWYFGVDRWARAMAGEFYKFQEQQFSDLHPRL